MFTVLIWGVLVVIVAGMVYAYAGSRDVFHPLMFIGPMMLVMYAWMPFKLDSIGGLDGFFQRDQLVFIQAINLCGVACFVLGCLSPGCRLPEIRLPAPSASPMVLVASGTIAGCVGLAAWIYSIINVGGVTAAFSQAYAGGYDDNGYIRDGSLLMFPAFLLLLAASRKRGFRILDSCLMVLFTVPWMIQGLFTARRGPTFMIAVFLTMGWYLNRQKRPSLVLTLSAGLVLGFLMLFLVANRGNIYLGSDRELSADVSSTIERPDTGNEYIYGAGSILSAESRESFYWGRRYLAEVIVRPIPHNIWPTKYEDFGLPELMHNAGTGEGIAETLGWQGADGSAPGVISDLWMEFRWLNMPVLFLLGRLYATTWQRAKLRGGPWIAQYVIAAALSVYFVMQTMEAVIFRTLILSIPVWLAWHFGDRPRAARAPALPPGLRPMERPLQGC
jgi:hypothetical protein